MDGKVNSWISKDLFICFRLFIRVNSPHERNEEVRPANNRHDYEHRRISLALLMRPSWIQYDYRWRCYAIVQTVFCTPTDILKMYGCTKFAGSDRPT